MNWIAEELERGFALQYSLTTHLCVVCMVCEEFYIFFGKSVLWLLGNTFNINKFSFPPVLLVEENMTHLN